MKWEIQIAEIKCDIIIMIMLKVKWTLCIIKYVAIVDNIAIISDKKFLHKEKKILFFFFCYLKIYIQIKFIKIWGLKIQREKNFSFDAKALVICLFSRRNLQLNFKLFPRKFLWNDFIIIIYIYIFFFY